MVHEARMRNLIWYIEKIVFEGSDVNVLLLTLPPSLSKCRPNGLEECTAMKTSGSNLITGKRKEHYIHWDALE